jgi:hypothetical protein
MYEKVKKGKKKDESLWMKGGMKEVRARLDWTGGGVGCFVSI